MSEPKAKTDDAHASAAEAFVDRLAERDLQGVEDVHLFGSTVRGDASGLASDVDFLVVVSDDADKPALEDELRDLAYDVMLEFGPVVEVHVLSRTAFERRREHPFVRRVLREGEAYV